MDYYNGLLDKKREIEYYLNNSDEMRILEKSEKNRNSEFYYTDFVSGVKIKVLRKSEKKDSAYYDVFICDKREYEKEELEIKKL